MTRSPVRGSFVLACMALAGLVPLLGATQRTPPSSAELQQLLDVIEFPKISDGQGGLQSTLRIVGVNVQIVNGLESTETTNGLGNLIVGYNEEGSFSGDDRTGSHNVIVGARNNHSSFGGLVVGEENLSSAPFSVATGISDTASGEGSSVTGGSGNLASGRGSTISGGVENRASGYWSWAGGGEKNVAFLILERRVGRIGAPGWWEPLCWRQLHRSGRAEESLEGPLVDHHRRARQYDRERRAGWRR